MSTHFVVDHPSKSEGETDSGLYLKSVWRAKDAEITSLDAAEALWLTELLYDYGLFLVHSDYRDIPFPEDFVADGSALIKKEHRLLFVKMERKNPLFLVLAIPAAVGIGKAVTVLGVGAAGVTLARGIVKLGADIAEVPIKLETAWEKLARARAEAAKAKAEAAKAKAEVAPAAAIAQAEVQRAVAEAEKAKAEVDKVRAEIKKLEIETDKSALELAEMRLDAEQRARAQESLKRRLERSRLRLVEEEISDEPPAA